MEDNQIQTVPCSDAGVAACMIVPEVLKENNYERWRVFMEHYLVAQDLWDVVLSIEMPKVGDPRVWVKKNALALHAIKISCGAKSFDLIKEMNSAEDAWNALAKLPKQPDEDASRRSETDTEVTETCTRILDNNKRAEIVSSLHDGNWDALKNLDRITEIIFPGGMTALHIATTLGHFEIVNELVKITREDYLEIQDDNGDTALSLAACNGKMEIAKCLVQKNNKLLTVQNNQGYAPLVVACVNCQKDMASYLYSKTHQIGFLLPENSNQGTLFLKYCLLNFMPDVGLDLFLHYPRLAAGREFITITELSNQPSLFRSGAVPFFSVGVYLWYSCISVAELPSPSDDDVTRRHEMFGRLEMFKRQVALVEKTDKILRFLFFPFHRFGKLRDIYDLKLTHMYANSVLCHLCKEMSTYRDATQLVESGAVKALFQAIKDGPNEIVNEILKANPDLIWCNKKLSKDIIISAIMHRQEDILKLDAGRKALISLRDKDGNNALHLAAKLPDYPFEDGVHAAWAMDREQKWFEEIKTYLPRWCHEAKNHYGETPDEVFKREHHELITEMGKWGKGTAESYSLASVLIVTIMFAALFTVPGGNDENTGMPILLQRKLFFWFLICDTVSFITASTSFLAFLSVLTLTYTRRGPRSAMPYQMLVAIFTLIISIVTMILAFIFALTMMLVEKRSQVLPAIMIYLLVVFFVMLSSWLVPTLSTLGDMIVSRWKNFSDIAYGRYLKSVNGVY